MCFGYDGEGALRRSLEEKGASRRSLFRGAAAGVAGAAVLGSGLAAPASAHSGHGGGHSQRSVPHDRISIQLYTLRDAMGGQPGFDTVLTRLAQYGYEKVEFAGYYGRTARQIRDQLDEPRHQGVLEPRRASAPTRRRCAPSSGTRRRSGSGTSSCPTSTRTRCRTGRRWADQMNAEAAVAKEYGLRYGYHNHAHEFTIDLGGGLTPWEVLTSRLDPQLVHLEVDLYWAYTGWREHRRGRSEPVRDRGDPRGAPAGPAVPRQGPRRHHWRHVRPRHRRRGLPADLPHATRWRSTSSRTTPPTSPRSPRRPWVTSISTTSSTDRRRPDLEVR